MKGSILLTALLAAGAFFAAQTTTLAADGAALFKEHKCYRCHGEDLMGNEDSGPKLKGSEFMNQKSDSEVAGVIKNGRQGTEKQYKNILKKMPAYNDKMSDEEIDAVVKFLRKG